MTLAVDEPLVLVVVEAEHFAEHVVVVLAEHRRAAVPAPGAGPGTRTRCAGSVPTSRLVERADPSARRDVRVGRQHLLVELRPGGHAGALQRVERVHDVLTASSIR